MAQTAVVRSEFNDSRRNGIGKMIRIALVGGLAVIVLGTFGSVAAIRFGIPYASFVVSFLIYLAVGVAIGRWAVDSKKSPALFGFAAGVIVGLVDAMIGLRIAVAMRPDWPPPAPTSTLLIAGEAFYIFLAGFFSLLTSVAAAAFFRLRRALS
jgi:hypothetical protein